AGSCAALGALLVAVTPPRWLGAGIALTAATDLALVASGWLTPASDALNTAWVTETLPQLQRVEIGPLTMGYADLFLPAVVGALLAASARTRRWVALLTLCFALAAGLFLLVADRLPATVPVALAWGSWLARTSSQSASRARVPGRSVPAAGAHRIRSRG
ncbi:MAG: hypothetical protein WBC33_09865, partial [Conexibacter sp.]